MLKLFSLLLWPMCLAYICEWQVQLSNFHNRSTFSGTILQQESAASLDCIFQNLSGQGIDPFEKLEHYSAFPYFLKISLSCETKEESKIAARKAHFQGMHPIATIIFQQPVHAVYHIPELLKIAMIGAPMADDDTNCLDEVCGVAWYVPLPYKNGSVVSEAHITSNKIGSHVPDKSLLLNIDGYLKPKLNLEIGVDQNIRQFAIGHEVVDTRNLIHVSNPSSPLWYLTDTSPTMILGGIVNRKVLLISTTEFDDFTILEVDIDSCWIGSLSCPQGMYTATLHNAIATESMLFIRQNQLMYYFKGDFRLLRSNDRGSGQWIRLLSNICVEKLIPVYLTMKDEEKLFVIGGGQQKAMTFIGTIRDGQVTFESLLDPGENTVCTIIKRDCLVLWAALDRFQNATLLLVEGIISEREDTSYYLVYYYFAIKMFKLHYKLPSNIPKERQGFLLLLGNEEYTDIPMIPTGITLSHMNSMAYVWGNFLFTSYNLGVTWLAVPGVPPQSLIRYFVPSWTGDFIFMTDIEELWYGKDGFPHLTRIRPSKSWTTFLEMQYIQSKSFYYKTEAILTVFFDRQNQLQEIVFAETKNGTTRIFKRKVPLEEILSYEEFFSLHYNKKSFRSFNYITFFKNCPFGIIRIQNVPQPQFYNRMQYYIAKPPWIFSNTRLYNNLSLVVYQGLLYGLLWLHATYYRPYADPIHDPTWRWWKNSWKAQHYYFFLASNKLSKGGFYVETFDYRKNYDVKAYGQLPPVIYLDKGNTYDFYIYLTVNTGKESLENQMDQAWLTALVSSPEYILVTLTRKEALSRGSLIYRVIVEDRDYYQGQSLTGENLVVLSVTLKVVNSDLACFREYNNKLEMQGQKLMKVYVGCPPGNRLAFDISHTIAYTSRKSNIYFDCIQPDSDMPCFYYESQFYPFFLIQDMVTGKTDQFLGRYTFKVIGGGPYIRDNIRYFTEDEVLMYNSVKYSYKYAAIWDTVGGNPHDIITTEEGYRIFSGDSFGIHIITGTNEFPTENLPFFSVWKKRKTYRGMPGSWICQKNSPCSDVPADGLNGPEYFMVIEVSNRGIDTSTYCDYRLEFIIHLHGLPLNPFRGLFFMLVTLSILWFILFSFIIFRCYQRWLQKKLKMVSPIETMILPARTGESAILYVHTANDTQQSTSSSSVSLPSTSTVLSSYNQTFEHDSKIHNQNVIPKIHY